MGWLALASLASPRLLFLLSPLQPLVYRRVPPPPRSPTLPHILALAIMIAETESRIHLHDEKVAAHSNRKERRPKKTEEEKHAAVEPQPIS